MSVVEPSAFDATADLELPTVVEKLRSRSPSLARSRSKSYERSRSPSRSGRSSRSYSISGSRSRSQSRSVSPGGGNTNYRRSRLRQHHRPRHSYSRSHSRSQSYSRSYSRSSSLSSRSNARGRSASRSRSRIRSHSRSDSAEHGVSANEKSARKDPRDRSKREQWKNNVWIVGEKIKDVVFHLCDICDNPIVIYGRLLPCRHVFCFNCTSKLAGRCSRCSKFYHSVDRCTLGGIFMCFESPACKRTYLSLRDLQAHISHRHVPKSTTVVTASLELNPALSAPFMQGPPPPPISVTMSDLGVQSVSSMLTDLSSLPPSLSRQTDISVVVSCSHPVQPPLQPPPPPPSLHMMQPSSGPLYNPAAFMINPHVPGGGPIPFQPNMPPPTHPLSMPPAMSGSVHLPPPLIPAATGGSILQSHLQPTQRPPVMPGFPGSATMQPQQHGQLSNAGPRGMMIDQLPVNPVRPQSIPLLRSSIWPPRGVTNVPQLRGPL